MQPTTDNILWCVTVNVLPTHLVKATVSTCAGVQVVLVASVIGHFSRLAPEQFALVLPGVALASVAIGVSRRALCAILDDQIRWTICRGAVALLRQVTDRFGRSADMTSLLGNDLTGLLVAALSIGTFRPFDKLAGGRIAARIRATFHQATIALFAFVNKAIATAGAE